MAFALYSPINPRIPSSFRSSGSSLYFSRSIDSIARRRRNEAEGTFFNRMPSPMGSAKEVGERIASMVGAWTF